MGLALLDRLPAYAAALREVDEAIRREAGWSVIDLLGAPDEHGLASIDRAQPAIFALQVALAAQLRGWGIRPAAVVGHSMGEVAAAHVAGALDLADAVRVIVRRSRLLGTVSGRGAMALVELDEVAAARALLPHGERVVIAGSNSPRMTLLSGDLEPVQALLAELEAQGIYGRLVKVDVASHGPQVRPLRPRLLELLAEVRPRPAAVPLLSTVDGRLVDGEHLDAAYWVRNLLEPVRFSDAVQQLAAAGRSTFLEVSPHPTLLAAIKDGLAPAQSGPGEPVSAEGPAGVALPSLRRGSTDERDLLATLGELWVRGSRVRWRSVYPTATARADLPTYAWQRTRHWYDEGPSAGPSARAGGPAGPGAGPLGAAWLPSPQPVPPTVPGADDGSSPAARPAHTSPPRLGELSQQQRGPAVEAWLCAQVAAVLRLAPEEVHGDQPLTHLGLDSLTALRVRRRVREGLDLDLPPAELLADPRPATLARRLVAAWQQLAAEDASGRPKATGPSVEQLQQQARLPEGFVPPRHPHGGQQGQQGQRLERVLLTGATGFLGTSLLQELLDRTQAEVICVVRAADDEAATARVHAALERRGWRAPGAGRVAAWAGDLALPGLGLSAARQAELAETTDTIFHCGAWLDFVHPYEALRGANVGGTRTLLELAARGRPKALHHVSSLGVTHGSEPPAGPLLEVPVASPAGLRLAYAQSKWVAEQLVLQAAARGLPVAVYRPSFVIGDSRVGAFNPDDALCRAIQGSVELGLAPHFDMHLPLCPVDVAAATLVDLAMAGAASPAPAMAQGSSRESGTASEAPIYHLSPPGARVAITTLVEALRQRGHELRTVTLADWLQAIEATLDSPRPSRLLPLTDALAVFLDGSVRARIDQVVDCSRVERLAPAACSRLPSVAVLLDRWLAAFEEQGYLPDQRARQST